MEAKQFGLSLDKTITLCAKLEQDTMVTRQISADLLSSFDLTPVDATILRSGSVTIYSEMLDILNQSIIGAIEIVG